MVFKKENSENTVTFYGSTALVVYFATKFNEKIKELKGTLKKEIIINLKIDFANHRISHRLDNLNDGNIFTVNKWDFLDIYTDEFIPMQYNAFKSTLEIKFLFVPDKQQTVIPVLLSSSHCSQSSKAIELDIADNYIQENFKFVDFKNLGDAYSGKNTNSVYLMIKDGVKYLQLTEFSNRREYCTIDHEFASYQATKLDNKFIASFKALTTTVPSKVKIETSFDLTPYDNNKDFQYPSDVDFALTTIEIDSNVDTEHYRRTIIPVYKKDILFNTENFWSHNLKINNISLQINFYDKSLNIPVSESRKLVSVKNPLLYIVDEFRQNKINAKKDISFQGREPVEGVSSDELDKLLTSENTFVLFVAYGEAVVNFMEDIFATTTIGKNLEISDFAYFVEKEEDKEVSNPELIRRVSTSALLENEVESTFLLRYKLDTLIKERFNTGDVKMCLKNFLTSKELNTLKKLGVNTNEF